MEDKEIIQLAKKVVQQEAEGILTLPDQLDTSFVKAVRLMLDCKGHVLVSGSGTSHSVARRLAHLLSVCGTPALLLDAGDSQHGLSGAITANDVVVAISKGGTTAEIVFLAKVAKDRGAKVIAITEKTESELGKLADVAMSIVAPPEVDPYGMIATGSSLFNCALGDALCVVLLNLRGYTMEQFGETHPGGAVGKKLKNLKII
jgi:D-arabinose 5-phosphate isomerase GutQ